VNGGWPGLGNIDGDPLFLNPDNGDFHLESVTGSFRDGIWQPDTLHSPCIDAGDPYSPYSNEPEPNGGRINMGYYGNTPEASLALIGCIVSGPVGGIWMIDNSPYHVVDNIFIPSGNTLIIDPGIEIIFHGYYKFEIQTNASLFAQGTEQDTILFTTYNSEVKWHGIRFLSASDSSLLEYCHIKRGLADGDFPDDNGGGIYCYYSNITVTHCLIDSCSSEGGDGGGICCRYSNALILDNTIVNNFAYPSYGGIGGGIYCCGGNTRIINNTIQNNWTWSSWGFSMGGGIGCVISNSLIQNNIICDNYSASRGGGIYLAESDATVTGNLISRNDCGPLYDYGAGICSYNSNPLLTNNTICDNPLGNGIYCVGSLTGPTINNCIIWGNTPNQIYVEGFANAVVSYSDVEGGWTGTGNIDANPGFISGPYGDYYLEQIAAGQVHQSPCVDTGDPYTPMILGTTRTDGVQDSGIVDMGYHYPIGVGDIPLDVKTKVVVIPEVFDLMDSFPNPFNPSTTISYALPKACEVKLIVYDIQGRVVRTLINQWQNPGIHEVTFDGSDLASGIYVYHIEAGEYERVNKMVLLK